MMKTTSERGQAAVVVIILLALGVIAFIGIYGMNSRQNYELANTIASSIERVSEGSAAEQALWTEDHARRHDKLVQSISSKCNESTGFLAHMKHPTHGRDAYICFVEGYWVVTVKQFDPARIEEFGDDIVTAFVRKSAKSVDDVIRYLQSAGYGL